jgi:hypothetical protein
MTDKVLDFFDWYELHDCPVQGMSFDFEKKTFILLAENFDNLANEYVPISLIFNGVSSFDMTYPKDDFDYMNICGIYSAEVQKNNNLYEMAFLLEMEYTKKDKRYSLSPVCKVQIIFQDFEYQGSFSKEAMQAKYID